VNLTKVESGCNKTNGEDIGAFMDSNGVKCCFDNHIGNCNPNTPDDDHCNQICLGSCEKGGECKIRGSKAPNHFCHCFC
jgi:hypothetical protein